MSHDLANANDGMSVGVASTQHDSGHWHCKWAVERWSESAVLDAQRLLGHEPTGDDFRRLDFAPTSVSLIDGNLLTTAGLGRIATLVNAGTGNLISSTTARVGTGNGVTAAAIGDTDLSASAGSANRWFQTCTVTTPSNVWTFVASFASADGNYAWQEFGIDIGTATVSSSNAVNAVLLNRKISSQGTKASGQVWTATATITIS